MIKSVISAIVLAALISPGGISCAVAAKVGVASAVNPQATGKAPGAAARTLVLGKKVVFNERIKTSANGLVQLLLLDGSAFTIGPNSEVVIDKFVYNPDKKTGEMVANVLKGAFRFVGGRLSKSKGGVTIRTPVATIGVRGGIVSGRVGGGAGAATFNFLFGDEMTVGTNCGGGNCAQTRRVFQNGNSVDVGFSGQLDLRPTRRSDIAAMQNALSGRPGTSGGARRKPTNTIVVQSGIRRQNSGQPPAQTATPRRRAIKATPIAGVETEIVHPGQVNGDQNRGGVSGSQTVQVRILETDIVLTTNTGAVINNPGSAGILGGDSAGSSYVEAAVLVNGRAFVAHIGQTSSVPYVESSVAVTAGIAASEFPVNDGVSYGGFALLGTGYVTQGGHFIYYQMFNENVSAGVGLGTRNLDEGVLVIGGTPTPSFDVSSGGGTLKIYEIGRDLRQGLNVPFTANNIFGDYSQISSTDLMLRQQTSGSIGVYPNDSSSRTVVLQGNLMIDGSGSAQRSFALLHSAFLYDDGGGGGPRINGAYRGSLRRAANERPATFDGELASVKGPDNNHFFGSGGIDNFVLGAEPDAKQSLHYSFADGSILAGTQDNHFGSYHLLARKSDIAPGAQGTRSTRTLSGYANGFREAPLSDAVNPGPVMVTSHAAGSGFEILFNPGRNTMWSSMVLGNAPIVAGDSLVNRYSLAFGSDPARLAAGSTGSAFIDDDTYGANGNRNGSSVGFISFPDANYPTSAQQNPETYLFGSELVEMTNFLPAGVSLCDCKFLEWGYWGGRLAYDDPSAAPGVKRSDYFHLGTWAAGDVITNLTPFSGTAYYSGHAIGNVTKVVGAATQRYLAAGQFDLTFDFGTRTGSAVIDYFDGRTINASSLAMSATAGQTHSYFGALTSAGPAASGVLNGVFVNGPQSEFPTAPGGSIGQFVYSESGYSAVGIVAAQQ